MNIAVFLDDLLRLSSHSRRVDGLWIGVLEKSDLPLLKPVEDALTLIEMHDPLRYRRILCDLKGIWVVPLPGALGSYNGRRKLCSLSQSFVGSSSTEAIASTIVHEATHARLRRRSIGYDEDLRGRVERACMRQELAFVRRLPANEPMRIQQEHTIQRFEEAGPSYWSNRSMYDRKIEGWIVSAQEVGMPRWLIKAAVFLARRRAKTLTSGI